MFSLTTSQLSKSKCLIKTVTHSKMTLDTTFHLDQTAFMYGFLL